MRKGMKIKNFPTIKLSLLFLVGLSVMLYPAFSNWWNLRHQTRAIDTYKEMVAHMEDNESEMLLSSAYAYNEEISKIYAPFLNYEEIPDYDEILNLSGTGVMGYVTIPAIRVELPIYHGTSESVLQVATGHLQGSSFPVGGTDTHAVISGHRGLPGARLFTDLDQIIEGDVFTIHVLNEVLTYEVDKILVIKPDEVENLEVIPGGDYVTLMTCTPYGINSHRLLVRGHRIETIADRTVYVGSDAVQIDQMKVLPFVAVPLILILIIYWNISGVIKRYIKRKLNEKYNS